MIVETKDLSVDIVNHIDNSTYLIFNLVWSHKDMSIILGKATHPHQAMQST